MTINSETRALLPVLINATPHVLNMIETVNPLTGITLSFDVEPSGWVTRVEEHVLGEGSMGITDIELGEIVGWPETARAWDIVVVSRPTAMAMAAAKDPRCMQAVFVRDLVRNTQGVIIGARGFARLS